MVAVSDPPKVVEDVFTAISFPGYPYHYGGACIVAGSAWCVDEDIQQALKLKPHIPIIAVNRTVIHYKSLFMVAIDYRVSNKWKKKAKEKWGPIEHHSGQPLLKIDKKTNKNFPHVDYWWPSLKSGGGTSVWLACKIAVAVGFTEVIVCGAPLERGPYLDGKDDWSHREDSRLEGYRDSWRRDAFMHPYVRSMSGWSSELLGKP